jgi:hypothetical protein
MPEWIISAVVSGAPGLLAAGGAWWRLQRAERDITDERTRREAQGGLLQELRLAVAASENNATGIQTMLTAHVEADRIAQQAVEKSLDAVVNRLDKLVERFDRVVEDLNKGIRMEREEMRKEMRAERESLLTLLKERA